MSSLEIDDFFLLGETITDISDLAHFAMTEEARGRTADALDLFRWTAELIDERCPHDPDLAELRAYVGQAIVRLGRPPIAQRR